MSEPGENRRGEPPSLDDLDARLRAARAQAEQASGDGSRARGPAPSGLGFGFRIAVELVAGTMVGVGLGWGLDWVLGTRPWLMVVFLFLGAAAGVMNVYRVAKGMDDAVGLGRAAGRKQEDRPEGS